MSVDKFRFVSPGVFVNEIDDSNTPRQAEGIGPVVIGRSLRGPVMRPVRVRDYSQFSEVFGEPHPGGTGGDIWREGNKSAPTYGAYAAQAYLKNSAPLTFIRLAGYQNDTIDNGGAAGWSMKEAYGIFVMPISGSDNVYKTPVGGVTASLAAVIYASGSSNYGLVGTPLSGGVGDAITTATLGTWIRTDSDIEFTAVLNGESKRVNFLEDSKKYIRTVLNTNPVLTNKTVTGDDSVEDYFLGESYKSFIESNSPGSNHAAVMVRLGNTAADINFANYQESAKKAESGWVVSQHKGLAADFVSGSDGSYPVQKLFKIHSLSEGDWNSQNIKISIEDIKEPANKYLKFGSFTLSVRKLQDNDLSPQYLERFTDLNLDPYSENYIAKRIGDKYSEWNYSKKAFDEYGTYNNVSKFIRVEVDSNVDAGLTDTDYIPYGFYLPNQYATSYVSASLASAGTIPFIKTSITGNQIFEARFALPTPPMMSSTTQSPTSNFNSVYFGVKTNIGDTKRFLSDVVDTLKPNPINYTKQGHADKPAFLFSLDDLSGSFKSGSLNPSQAVSWQRDNRKNKLSMTAVESSSVLLSNFNRFTLPLVGGSDGVDITQKDPFCYEELLTGNEYTNYAYNSVKVAIESIADAEVVEMNLASVPGVVNPGLTSLLIEKCELRGDALAVIDLEGDLNPSKIRDSKTAKPTANSVLSKLSPRNLNSSYGCAFYPWVLIKDVGNNNTVWVPPSVVALGTFSSSQAKTELWFAPAGFNRGGLSDGAAGLPVIQTAARVSSKERDDLYTANVNPIATFPSEGIVIFGQKTLQATPSALDRINVRRLMIYVKKEISRMASTVLFDPNVQITWKRFTDQAEPFLANIKSRFGLSDFKVVLDKSTTTPDLVDRNIVYAKIMLKPTRAIEFIGLDFVITNSGASFAD